jgi:hypothetical protein
VSFHEAISLDLQSFIPMALENSPWKQTQRNFAQRVFFQIKFVCAYLSGAKANLFHHHSHPSIFIE